MGFKCGIIGLPNVGKSSLFNALVGMQKAASENYPFCTIEPNVGKVPVPDQRLDKLADINMSKNSINAQIEFVDIAGLVKGASRGEGLGNKFLSHIREVDALAHVVRCFSDKNVTHVHDRVDPGYDLEIIESELILSDLERAENMISKTSKLIKNGKKVYQKELNLLEKIYRDLEKGNTNVVDGKYVLEELNIIKKFGFLTLKPIMYVCNLDEKDLEGGNIYSRSIDKLGYERNVSVVKTSAKLEAELSSITNKIEKKEFMESMNIKKSGLDKFISEGFKLLNLITFFTSGEKESKAWTIKNETLAPKAAGSIHTDFERGFIAADVINYEELVNAGGEKEAKNKGLLRTEGKDYVVKDGDVMLFRFNV